MLPRQIVTTFSVLTLVCFLVPGARGAKATTEFSFDHEDVLGTSLQLNVCAPDAAAAERSERAVLAEIERMRRILSTRDTVSEISRLNTATGPVSCSDELRKVLAAFEWWNTRSAGAYNGHLGELIGAWRAAERAGVLPEKTSLAPIVQSLAQPGWELNSAKQTVTRHGSAPLNVDSLGKGYIIGRALAAARAAVPEATGLLLNIGGDIQTWGGAMRPTGSGASASPTPRVSRTTRRRSRKFPWATAPFPPAPPTSVAMTSVGNITRTFLIRAPAGPRQGRPVPR